MERLWVEEPLITPVGISSCFLHLYRDSLRPLQVRSVNDDFGKGHSILKTYSAYA
jgi:hypothetical protein